MSQTSRGLSFLRRVSLLAVVAVGGTSAAWILRPDRLKDAHITSGSMASSFWGPGFRVTCGDCGFSFRCGAEKKDFVPSDRRAVCPNCAYGDNPLTPANGDQFGQQVKLDPGSLHRGALHRWDPVAFRAPGKSNSVGIKRIVGLPNEWIAIRRGDIYVDGRLLRKPLAAQRELSLLVHEATFRSSRNPQRNPWKAAAEDSRWIPTDTGFFVDSTGNAQPGVVDWLEYCNLPTEPLSRGVQRPDEAPINDNSGYNQGISRGLNDVHDVMLSCWVRLLGAGDLVLGAIDRDRLIEITVSARTHLMSVSINGRVVQRIRIPSMVNQPRKLELSLYDRQCLLAIDGRPLAGVALPVRSRCKPVSRPFRIGAKSLQVWVSHLRIYRDTYHLNDRGLALPWRVERRLGYDEYFLLGDNPPISLDSRHWSPSGVARKSLLGKVLRATETE